MNFVWNFPLFTIVLSLFSGVLCMMLSSRAARNYTITLECVLIFLAVCVLRLCLRTGVAYTYPMGEFPAPWGNEIRAGVLEAALAVVFLVVLLCSVLAGYHFLREDIDESKQNLYYSLLNLLTAALMAMTWTNDVFTGYVFLEILTLTSCGILIVREIGRTTLAAVRYMILNLLGSGLFLLGVVLLYGMTGHLLMVPMRETIAVMVQDPGSIPLLSLSVGVMTVGIAIKSGLFPFHFWMPDTYGWATPTSGSVMSSLVSKGYLFLLFKIYFRAIGFDALRRTPILKVLFVLGISGMIVGSISAMRSDSINRMIAFSSTAQIGYIYMGIGMGTTAAFGAALFHIFSHAVTKSLLFVTTPYLAEVSGNSLRFKALQGSGHRDRAAGLFFTVGGLSMVGIPILAGFASKLMFAQAAVQGQSTRDMLLVMTALGISSLLNGLYFIRTLIRIYSEQTKEQTEKSRGPIPGRSRIGFLVGASGLTALNLFLGLYSWVLAGWIYRGIAMFL